MIKTFLRLITAVMVMVCFNPVVRAETGSALLKEVVVEGDLVDELERKGLLKPVIIKTEVITERDLESKQAKSLFDAIENEPGIDAVTGCAICGMRRVQINGLKGEYTTLLQDGVPLNSTVSSYYGFDALTTGGVSRIEIARGSGAALIAPEAIGGVINIISKKPTETSAMIDVAAGGKDDFMFSILGTGVSEDGSRRFVGSGDFFGKPQVDSDDNNINEAPRIKSQSAILKFSKDLNPKNNLDFRLSYLNSHTFGGAMEDSVYRSIVESGKGLQFVDNDVRKKYIGDPVETTEIIDTNRHEWIVKWTSLITDKSNLVVTGAGAKQIQDSVYEGSDYYGDNQTLFGDVKSNIPLPGKNLLTMGLNYKKETLRSESFSFFETLGRAKDDFDVDMGGLYIQDVWTPSSIMELSAAVRLDDIQANFRGQDPNKNEIDETLVSPRVHAKIQHGDYLASRFSGGRGYRAPLTFFESEHGILDDGFAVSVTDLEKSKACGYALSLDSARWTGTASYNYTEVDNMAFVDTENFALPTLVNSQRTVNVKTADIVLGYQLTPTLSLGASYENFDYQNSYKELLTLAAVEDRVRFLLGYDNDKKGWMADASLNWVGSRDLKPYGYGDRYNVFDGTNVSAPKSTDAPSYLTVDLKISKLFNNWLTVYAGAKNLFDTVQVDKESPLLFDADGNYDVVHIWGPLRGRELYAGAKMKFGASGGTR